MQHARETRSSQIILTTSTARGCVLERSDPFIIPLGPVPFYNHGPVLLQVRWSGPVRKLYLANLYIRKHFLLE